LITHNGGWCCQKWTNKGLRTHYGEQLPIIIAMH